MSNLSVKVFQSCAWMLARATGCIFCSVVAIGLWFWLAAINHPKSAILSVPSSLQRRFDMAEKLLTFDMARYLGSDAAITEYLTQVLADGDPDELLSAIGHIAKAKGMAQVAKDAGLGRESLYKALAPGAKPRFDTILRVTRALGITLSATSTL